MHDEDVMLRVAVTLTRNGRVQVDQWRAPDVAKGSADLLACGALELAKRTVLNSGRLPAVNHDFPGVGRG